MSLFQKSVLNKYLKLQDATLIDKAYKKYTKYFHNLKIQENILISKEEQFQQKFLIELFENIFGYTIFPDENYNLTTEFKNLRGAKKADGAILVDGKAICVIELKGTKTKDLESIRQQAFDYKSSHPTCKYIVTSNFEKIRFYIETSEELEEFNLFTLTRKEFDLLYLCLHKDNMLNNIPLKIKEASVVKEEQITKEFYNDYSLFKRELYRDLIKQNLKNPIFRTEQEKENIDSINKNIKLSLFKKSQKLIDRFLFIFFAEDSGLLPPNSTLQILENWDKLKDLDVEVPLYNRFKLYFKYLDTGREGTDKKAEIFAYNGGLFKPDAVLNSLILDDKLLYKHTKKLSEYDFNSQVDVNILGHIFENSLNEIESVNAEIQGTNFDKQTSKRKKDGVFYTPKYITKYIVDNTVGKLCIEKKIELGIKEDDYFKGRKNRNKTTIIKLVSFLDVYRDWLLKLTICDPACGSGAFLNQALDFLIKEHTYIDELKTKLLGGGFIFPDIENTILEKNIFGVDLNEESVEIAKLSLWLRTAQPRRKLNNLNSNIKCGNSLIDSKSVAGDKAFKWENEFPQIFEKKSKKLYLVTFVTHNSRISDRMMEFNPPEFLKELQPFYFENEDYSKIIDLIASGIQKYKISTVQFTVLPDHTHLLVSAEDEKILTEQIRKLKGYTSFEFQRYKNWDKSENNLWAQKFHKKEIDIEVNKIASVISYIENNLEKHRERWFDNQGGNGLKPVVGVESEINNGLQPIVSDIEVNLSGNGLKPVVGVESEINNGLQPIVSDIEVNLSGNGLKPVVDVESEINNGLQPIALQEFITDKLKKLNKEICVSYKEATQNKGGFDVIIGNPPYKAGRHWSDKDSKLHEYLSKVYKTADYQLDLYVLFYERSLNLIKKKEGLLSFITPNTWFTNISSKGMRNYFLTNTQIIQILDCSKENVFEDAVVETAVVTMKFKEKINNKVDIFQLKNNDVFNLYSIDKKNWLIDENFCMNIYVNEEEHKIKSKIDKIGKPLGSFCIAKFGVKFYQTGKGNPKQTKDIGLNRIFESKTKQSEEYYKMLEGKDVNRYNISWKGRWIKYGKHLAEPRNIELFQGQRFLVRRIMGEKIIACWLEESMISNALLHLVKVPKRHSAKVISAIVSSKLMAFYYRKSSGREDKAFPEIKVHQLRSLPIVISDKSIELELFVNKLLSSNNVFYELSNKFQNYLKQKFQLEKLSKKLQNWHDLEFGDFIKELNKAIKSNNKELVKNELPIIPVLTKLDEMDWMDVFTVKKSEAQALQTQINQTDKEIDTMVYKLYNLTAAEIAIVENS
ncbi:Eco57I restriction-modification methylase domain-containing protein [Tenacibaculum finnmarkense]|uniref:Eco57I restriction-modification methylase domain-containing protein n=1 Tax=Tenacibaculum finnmarkense TaxID=2781243 RepID=UPI00293EAE80|nr:TaqI-like C-terminal specificity domain-containing protein [Tenacibaculum finnmarkense]